MSADSKTQTRTGELDPDDRMLILLRDELYEGRWDLMRQDLTDRREGKPYIFKLVNRIEVDLARIDRLERLNIPAPSATAGVSEHADPE